MSDTVKFMNTRTEGFRQFMGFDGRE